MCINIPKKVIEINGDIATMEDGTKVRIGMVKDVKVGDPLEVYGDVAIGKVDTREASERG